MLTSKQITQTSLTGKIQLSTPESEKALIANILSGSFPGGVISTLPTGEYFSDDKLGQIYKVALDLKKNDMEIDFAVLSDSLRSKVASSELAHILTESYNDNPMISIKHSDEAAESHAFMIREAWAKRNIYLNLKSNASMDEVIAVYKEMEKSKGKLFKSDELAGYLFDMIAKRALQKDYMQFPFDILKKATMGLRAGQMIIVGSRPSVGKTSFLENIAFHLAEKGKNVLFASAEMDAESLGLRTLSRLSGIDLFRLRDPSLLSGILSERYNEAIDRYSSSKMLIYDLGAMPLPQLDSLLEKELVDIVFLDYLSLVEPGKKYRGTYEKVTFASQEIKRMAVKHKVPFIVASQYNRVAANIQPKMSDLRDSGQVEQDADVVISLWTKGEEINGRTKVYIDLLKNRNGYTFANNPNKEYYLWFEKARTTFHDVSYNNKVVDSA